MAGTFRALGRGPPLSVSVLVLGDGSPALLAALAQALGPGDRLAWVAATAAGGFALRLARESRPWPEAVPCAIADPPLPSGLRGAPEAAAPLWRPAAVAIGLALLEADPPPLVTLPGDLDPDLAGPRLEAIRTALGAAGTPLRLRFEAAETVLRLDHVVLDPALLRRPLPDAAPRLGLGRLAKLLRGAPAADPAADPATDPAAEAAEIDAEPALVALALAGATLLALPLALAGPAPCPPEAGPAAARGLARLAAARPDLRPALAAALPALYATAPPGARASAAPILAAAGLAPPPPPPILAAPARVGAARIALHLVGRHAVRCPFAYPALAGLHQDWTRFEDDPARADLIVAAHPLDLWDIEPVWAERAYARPKALISEEPFWDSLFSPDPTAETVLLPAAHWGEARLAQLNHHRSALFDFDRIPYFLFTDAGLIPRLAALFARNARHGTADWRRAFATRPQRLVFMAERRDERFHDLALREAGLVGLSAWRSRVALAAGEAAVRLGASWQGGASRFELADWHADKLARLDGQTVTLSALENTTQPTYLSEKLFDAFAVGARPLYSAPPGHGAFRLGLPAASWLNAHGLTEAETAARALAAPPRGFFAAYAEAQRHLAALLADRALLAAERQRMAAALRAETAACAGF